MLSFFTGDPTGVWLLRRADTVGILGSDVTAELTLRSPLP